MNETLDNILIVLKLKNSIRLLTNIIDLSRITSQRHLDALNFCLASTASASSTVRVYLTNMS